MPSEKKRSGSVVRGARRTVIFLLLTLILITAFLLGVIYVMEKGPSPTATELFCRSVRETSAIKWIATIFLSPEELAAMQRPDAAEETQSVNVSRIHVEHSASSDSEMPYLTIEDVRGSTYKGKMMIVRDPKSIIVGTADALGREGGLQLTDLVAKYDGIAGINGGGFNDENGRGDGGTPQGLVISQGEILYGNENSSYSVVGITEEGILLVGVMTGREALDRNVRWAVSFNMDGAISGALVVNGEVQEGNLASGVNPRTAIGQRADGAILLLVLDGRQIDTLGATLQDICDVMLAYGAVNVGNLDGGSSSVMVYRGDIINSCASITGPRYIPDGFIVLREGSYE